MKVYDCFLFSHELDLLEIRLNVLREVVDQFIIVEARHTHSGEIKEAILLENLERFREFPIEYRCIDIPFAGEGYHAALHREGLQRKNLRDVLLSSHIDDDDVVLMGDLDEIPNPVTVADIGNDIGFPCRLVQDHFYWWLNALDAKPWNSGTIMMCADRAKANLFERLRLAPNLPLIQNGGWHFSSVGTEGEIIRKLQSFIHTEYGSGEGLEMAMCNREQFLSIHGQPLALVDMCNAEYPDYLRETWRDKYSHLVYGTTADTAEH